jgi:hypothetical protein
MPEEAFTKFIYLSVTLDEETANTFRDLMRKKHLTQTQAIREAILTWKSAEDVRLSDGA